jgi:peptidoglycan/xylan/chitin deacetylase (PgdA/CDA1 family)
MHAVWRKAGALVPFRCWRTLADISLVLPYYHMVSDMPVAHVRHLYRHRSVREFNADLEFFLQHMEPLGLSDVLEIVEGSRRLRRPSFHLTFDDGFREMRDVVAPLLHARGIPATFFVNTGFLDQAGMAHHNVLSLIIERLIAPAAEPIRRKIDRELPASAGGPAGLTARLLTIRYRERALVWRLAALAEVDLDRYLKEVRPYVTSEDLRDLMRLGFAIGAHSHDHPLYADLALSEQLAQTETSMEGLASRFALPIRAFAFPHSDAGVGPEFFRRVFSGGLLQVSFGTGGMVPHFHPRNLQRVSMEKTSAPAAAILARQCARTTYRKGRARLRL